MIIYIHGFAGSAKGTKAILLREKFNSEELVAPSLSYIPDLAIDTLEQMIKSYAKYERVSLIGSSLGGFYAIYLATKYNLKAALINPAVSFEETLTQMVGNEVKNVDMSKFEWNEKHIEMLKKYAVPSPNPQQFFLLTQTGDELLDYQHGVEYLKDAKMLVIEGGNHGFEGFEKYIDKIVNFFE